MAYREFITCKTCGRIYRDACLSCGCCLVHESSGDLKIRCPQCGSSEKQNREKRKYFICPDCFEPVIEEEKLKDTAYDLSSDNYCTNCGREINSVLQQERQMLINTADEKSYTKDFEYSNVFSNGNGIAVEFRIKAEHFAINEMQKTLSFLAQSSHRFYLETADKINNML